jgi:hypothetical protein
LVKESDFDFLKYYIERRKKKKTEKPPQNGSLMKDEKWFF